LRDEKSGKAELSLGLELKAEGPRRDLPLFITREVREARAMLRSTRRSSGATLKFDLATNEAGWGKIELPADEAPRTMLRGSRIRRQCRCTRRSSEKARVRRGCVSPPRLTKRGPIAPRHIRGEPRIGGKWNDARSRVDARRAPDETWQSAASLGSSGGVLLCFPPVAKAARVRSVWLGRR
jgi:hypothetical protein